MVESPSSLSSLDLDPERQRLAREYARIRRRLFFGELAATAVGVVLLLVAGWSLGLRQWAESVSPDQVVQVGLYGLVLGVVYTVLTLPLSFYSGFTLPRRYGLSVQSPGGWITDTLKELAISAVLGLI